MLSDLEKASGISRDTLIRYESGRTEPTPEKLLALAIAPNVKLDKLCDPYFQFRICPFYQRIKEWRKTSRMTQQEFAKCCGYPLARVKRWEQGIHCVTREQWQMLASLFTL